MPLLSEASSIKVGSSSATAAYIGTTLVWPLSTGSTFLMVSGAGDTSSNGLYNILAGYYNGYPYWQNQEDSRYFLIWDSAAQRWGIGFSGTNDPYTAGFIYETDVTTADSPVGLSFTGATTPNPTVQVAYSVLVSGAGDTSANGVYTYGGIYLNYPYYTKGVYEIYRGSGGIWLISNQTTVLYSQITTELPTPYNVTNPWDVPFLVEFSAPAPTVTAVPFNG